MKPTNFLLALALLGGLAVAQQASTAPDMSKPPAVAPFKAYAPPAAHRDQLPNGLRIVVVEDHRFPLVTVQLALRAGSSRMTPQTAGLASAEADLLTKGTPTRNALQIAQAADALGGAVGAGVDPDFLTIYANGLSDRVPALFALLADVTLHPTFPESEVNLERANMLQGLRASRANPGFLASVQFYKLLFGNNPYAITAPTEASIAGITRDALQQFHQNFFLPNNQGLIVITGDISEARAHNLAEQYFGTDAWKFGRPTPPPSPPVSNPATRRIYLVERPGSAQSTILLGGLGLTRTAPDYFSFRVANQVLGGGFTSRLNSDLREEKGYTYGISSGNTAYRELGAWTVSTDVRTAVTAPALKEILSQMDQMRTAPPSTQEMSGAKNYINGNFVLGLETQGQVAGAMMTQGLYGLPPDWLAGYAHNVSSVTGDEALAAAQSVVKPDHTLVVVVGDVKQIEASLANLAPGTMMTIFNDRGEVIGSYPPEKPAGGKPATVHPQPRP